MHDVLMLVEPTRVDPAMHISPDFKHTDIQREDEDDEGDEVDEDDNLPLGIVRKVC